MGALPESLQKKKLPKQPLSHHWGCRVVEFSAFVYLLGLQGGTVIVCFEGNPTVDGRNPANQLRLVVYPIIYRVFCTSQVVQDFFHQQYQPSSSTGFPFQTNSGIPSVRSNDAATKIPNWSPSTIGLRQTTMDGNLYEMYTFPLKRSGLWANLVYSP